ncbi:Emi1p [Ascoidea rubescens DSM 1968]|uniref:Early meiotic induction protein 1 n=1 Tax=Ascoidea rubescens DSM 1968 TaxID=1344418 RepID=A0A1D2VP69_9ASCO|nr:early meiotic induction protein 1 [Ascoidea rubescens DSM 1968]ODV63398.1 early meiotic induction protein 1 [Ascoidea rubescens DSM 1968]
MSLITKKGEGKSDFKSEDLEAYPSEMSCLTAFDDLFQCYSVVGQFRNVYRYGEIDYCNSQLEKFKFCLKNSINSEDIKKRNIQLFYKEKLMMKKQEGSSEDIWKLREI